MPASATPQPAPYVALGDSLTHGMQSMGIAAVSQVRSYPKQIADFLGAPFQQPVLKGYVPGKGPQGHPDAHVGNPPNLELVLRRAEALLSADSHATLPCPTAWKQLHDEVDAIAAVLREALTDYVSAVEDAQPDDLLAEPAPPAYQNLGVAGFTVQDVSTATYAQRRAGLKLSFRGQVMRLAREALDGAAKVLTGDSSHPSLLHALTSGLLASGQHDFGARMSADLVGNVLGRGALTALDLARAQQPRIVTLWIGNNDVLTTMCNCHIWDGDTPLYTPPNIFRDRLALLLDAVLNFQSHPHVFLATLPSPTASPNLVRNRLGHWKSMLPSAAFLLDAQLLELESVIAEYNAAIRQLARQREGRVWLVDVHSLQERMQRATRDDLKAARLVVEHAVRAGYLDTEAANDVLGAVRAGNLATIRHTHEVAQRLANRPFTEAAQLAPEQAGAYLTHRELSSAPTDPSIDAFTVRLANGRPYRLTGEYLSADDSGAIAQGGAVSLDAVHLTNTGYAYVAREFLRAIYAADTNTRGAVLQGLPGQRRDVKDFDAALQQVARDDSLLNGVPRLLPAVLDAAGAAADLLGELHFSDPYLTR